MSSSKLFRSRTNKKVAGLCGGLSEVFNIDVTLLRLVVAVAAIFTSGAVILVYFVAAMIVPKEPRFTDPYDPYGQRGPYNNNHNNPYGNPYGNSNNYGRNDYRRPEAPPRPGQYRATYQEPQSSDNIDDMMKDIEKKAMQREIEDLRIKLNQLEKNQNKNQNNEPKGDV
ncbi:PspC domain-containing protein [Paenibacillus sp. N1-5-1-14]|uniref:PspC domain-containing protein n=1 Tax=Paenibacillus radicibacter TaxID=2972488 RepID=UPI0021598DAE|nr:PspC domain-containing protein [Paenibacillus radicibacter]MCR8643114.1 PspC domain-containing protein [Paenibacillus radicibacter]